MEKLSDGVHKYVTGFYETEVEAIMWADENAKLYK